MGEQTKAKNAKLIRGIVHENDTNEGTHHVQGWRWDDTKGGWLDFELRAKTRREEVTYVLRERR